MGKILGPDGKPVGGTPSVDIFTTEVTKHAKEAALEKARRENELAEKNPEALKNSPYIWKPEIEYDPAKVPDFVGNHQKAAKGLSPDEEAEFHKFMDFLAETLMGRVDPWVERGFYDGSWHFHLENGRLSINASEEYSAMQREHIATQVWDALSQVPNRYIEIVGG